MNKKLNGAPLMALLAAGLGCFSLGVLTMLTETFPKVMKPFLSFNDAVGPLSGKTTLAVFIFLMSWLAMVSYNKNKNLDEKFWLKMTFGFVGLGIVLTFPPVYQFFAPHA